MITAEKEKMRLIKPRLCWSTATVEPGPAETSQTQQQLSPARHINSAPQQSCPPFHQARSTAQLLACQTLSKRSGIIVKLAWSVWRGSTWEWEQARVAIYRKKIAGKGHNQWTKQQNYCLKRHLSSIATMNVDIIINTQAKTHNWK